MIKVLILDDANVIRSLLKLTLESDGIEADSVATLDEAMNMAQNKNYDLMIVDYMLDDGHNGLELVAKIKTQGMNRETPCIMLSAEDGQTCKTDAKKLGVKAWVKKPFTPTGILKVVYQAIGKDFHRQDTTKSSIHRHD